MNDTKKQVKIYMNEDDYNQGVSKTVIIKFKKYKTYYGYNVQPTKDVMDLLNQFHSWSVER